MATETLKSGSITNRDANTKTGAFLDGGILQEVVGVVEAVADSGTSSKYVMCQVPSECRISSIQIFADDMGDTGLVDIGVFETTEHGGGVVDADILGVDVDLNAAALNGSDVTFKAVDIAKIEKRLWEILGFASDPGRFYDLVITPTEALELGGTISFRVRYTV